MRGFVMSYLRPLASVSSLLAIERRSALNYQRADVVGSFLGVLGINHNNIRSLGGTKMKSGCGIS